MWHHKDMTTATLFRLIRNGSVQLAGNRRLHIYGTLRCRSGKRMLRGNRIFFSSREEAQALGYRPCAHCMHAEYKKWKR